MNHFIVNREISVTITSTLHLCFIFITFKDLHGRQNKSVLNDIEIEY